MHHGAGLRKLLAKDGMADSEQETLIAALCDDYQKAALTPADLAMLRYTEKLTLTPGNITGEDVAALRNAGFDDRGIHDICTIVAYFAFVNRIADGLGVELEPRFE